MTTTDFNAIPILDMGRIATDRAAFLEELQHALVHVGFFYVVNHGVPNALLDSTTAKAQEFFDLGNEDKLVADKIHSPTFLGYSTQGNEITKNKKDNREQFDFANELAEFWKPGNPDYERLTGPNVWPSQEVIPGFTDAILTYHAQAQGLAERLTDLVSESLGLDPKALAERYVDPTQQHRAKLIKYPAVDALAPADGNQGVGAHRDTGNILTVLYQADLPGLQVQNHAGEWIDAPVVPYSFVVNIGTGLEYLVDNVAVATTHRVLNPPPGRGPRYSIAYFHGSRLDRKHTPIDIPAEVLAQKPTEVITDTAGFQYAKLYSEDPGLYSVVNRCSSHRDVAVKFYPELCKLHGIKLEDGNVGY
jgi:isopenicillin N synthase-like dioxygenase